MVVQFSDVVEATMMRYRKAEAIGQLAMALGDLPTRCEPSGTEVAVEVREGDVRQERREIGSKPLLQIAIVDSFCSKEAT